MSPEQNMHLRSRWPKFTSLLSLDSCVAHRRWMLFIYLLIYWNSSTFYKAHAHWSRNPHCSLPSSTTSRTKALFLFWRVYLVLHNKTPSGLMAESNHAGAQGTVLQELQGWASAFNWAGQGHGPDRLPAVMGSSAELANGAWVPLSIQSPEEKSKHEPFPVLLNCFPQFLAWFSKAYVMLQRACLSSCPSDF